ncbi:MAG: hypothetical protein K6F95_01580 [Selenomonas sp.]|uniref:hypothetical protein n=1 Tax=Selenomonas sp. TaxID=2053611 RepID=UPI0025FC474D|nr:hypothetical protein [Selenomonas sp.]MCR5756584.1 hypothetical protein [Selenomonas sp.]
MNSQRRAKRKSIMPLFMVAALLLTLTCLAGIFSEDGSDTVRNAPPAVATAAGALEKPQIVGGFVPERHHGLPEPRQEAFFLSWDFINGLFVLILLMEFIIFPFLFWLWFGKHDHTENK